ncbi:hypothetical protein STEG23_003042, partial [Scotinomys teguina]
PNRDSWIECPKICRCMGLKFPVYKPDLSPRLTLMLTPSLKLANWVTMVPKMLESPHGNSWTNEPPFLINVLLTSFLRYFSIG